MTNWPLKVWQGDNWERKCPNLNLQWCLPFLELNHKPEGKGAIDAMLKDQSLEAPSKMEKGEE